ncbi:hypothetical protein [Streptomyces lunalinharesii]|uniref:Lipoprotein n=1 Tax=Streptomyces lunalinharesii TaxID=333384 RepID=A0ABN3RNZ5_9ACTN
MRSSTTVRIARSRSLRVGAAALTAAAALSLVAWSGSGATDAQAAGHPSARAAVADASPAGWSGLQSVGAKAALAGEHSGSMRASTAKSASPVRTQTLVDGSTARIYDLGRQRYRAEIVSRGAVLATLETTGEEIDAGLDANDMFVVLTMGGEVRSWMGGGQQGPGTFHLAGGWTAKVTKVGELRYRAQIIGHDGSVDATLETKGHDVGLDANGVSIVLSAGGVISAHE